MTIAMIQFTLTTVVLLSCCAVSSGTAASEADDAGVGAVDLNYILGCDGLFGDIALTNTSLDSLSSTVDKFHAILNDENTGTLEHAYSNYAAHYKKMKSVERKAVFKTTLLNVFQHNLRAMYGQETFRMGINKFSDLTLSELKAKYTGLVSSGNSSSAKVPNGQKKIKTTDELPESFDWRELGVITPPKDQGYCGSCVLFSTTGAVESAMAISGNVWDLDLSEQQLLDCPEGEGVYYCEGNALLSIYSYMMGSGLTTEAEYPYTAEKGECQSEEKTKITKVQEVLWAAEGDEEAMKELIGYFGPSSVSLIVNDGFQSYSSGIMNYPCDNENQQSDHSVLVVGYGSDGAGQDFWIAKNSWGTEWGDNGYIKLARNANNICKIADEVFVPVLE